MWRLTITQKRKETYSDGKEFDVTNEVKFELDELFTLLDIISKFERVDNKNTTYKIEKVIVDFRNGQVVE